jgi:hypothetical protein
VSANLILDLLRLCHDATHWAASTSPIASSPVAKGLKAPSKLLEGVAKGLEGPSKLLEGVAKDLEGVAKGLEAPSKTSPKPPPAPTKRPASAAWTRPLQRPAGTTEWTGFVEDLPLATRLAVPSAWAARSSWRSGREAEALVRRPAARPLDEQAAVAHRGARDVEALVAVLRLERVVAVLLVRALLGEVVGPKAVRLRVTGL